MADDIDTLKRKRAALKSTLTRFKTYLDAFTDNAENRDALAARLEKIKRTMDDFEDIQLAIEILLEVEVEDQERTQFEENYYTSISRANNLIRKNSINQINNVIDNVNMEQLEINGTAPSVKLPTIELPKFNGKLENWLNFSDAFKAIIHDNVRIQPVQKLHYLRSCLEGEAANMIESLGTTANNYQIAWDLLVERYENDRINIQNHVRLLCELPSMTRESAIEVKTLIDGALKHIRILTALKVKTEEWDAILLHTIATKLDRNTRKEWESTLTGKVMPKMDELWTFLRNRCHLLETMHPETFRKKLLIDSSNRNGKYSHLGTTGKTHCPACREEHHLYNCEQFRKLKHEGKVNVVKSSGLCLNCLRKGHFTSACRAMNCKKCNRKHHTLLHKDIRDNPNDNEGDTAFQTALNARLGRDSQVALSTALVDMIDAFGNLHQCRVILDVGSQANFLTSGFCKKMSLKTTDIKTPIKGVGETISYTAHASKATIKSKVNAFTLSINWLIIPSITGAIPSQVVDKECLNIPSNVQLADPLFHHPGEIDGLIGAEHFYKLLSVGQIKLDNRVTMLQKTVLGWIVAGNVPNQSESRSWLCNFAQSSLDSQVEKFWLIEEASKARRSSPEDIAVERHYVETVQRTSNGRYQVALPFKGRREMLGESRCMALRRLNSMERKLATDPAVRQEYRDFLREYQALGHMSEVSEKEASNGYFIPHHAIIRADKMTTKLRVVFDASAKTSASKSLNDILMVGPTIQDDLFVILLRFRTFAVALTADIEKMYRQVLVRPEDRVYQQILWRDDPDQDVKTYRLNTLTYGTAPASFLATRTLRQLVEEEGADFPEAAAAVLDNMYMDDVLTGARTVAEAIELKDDLVRLMKLGGFNLRKWSSNVLEAVNDSHLDNDNSTMSLNLSETQKALGIYWKPAVDTISYQVKDEPHTSKWTKRVILSQIASLFDPLGLLSPIIITAKIIMQKLWKLNISWDESVPQVVATEWVDFRRQLPTLSELNVPRYIAQADASDLQLHGFCDASEVAYGACLYLRSETSSGTTTAQLICAKTRVAPLQKKSLPRLELCAAVLLAELVTTVTAAMQLGFQRVVLWSDSMITLHWIGTPSHQLKTFEGNRVATIHEATKRAEWRHVPSGDNPADLASRGISPALITQVPIWFSGPSWLTQSEYQWPEKVTVTVNKPEYQLSLAATLQDPPSSNQPEDFLCRVSSWKRLVRVVAYCYRFVNNIRLEVKQYGALSAKELTLATRGIIFSIQSRAFSTEIKTLRDGRELPSSSKLLSLNPFMDDNANLRVGGRLKNADLTYDQTHPIILPENNFITDLILKNAHVSLHHAGAQATLYAIRQRFWPINGRARIRKIIRQCLTCCRCKPPTPEYLMGDLPKSRFDTSRPFAVTGVDFCGPFFVKERKNRNVGKVKVYVSVFICMATKAVHLEVVGDLTTEAFVGALKRFVSRRGKVREIWSDNATNFQGTRNELRDLGELFVTEKHVERLNGFVANQGIEWRFIPPRSPHFGGIWEAAVRSFKHHLIRVARDTLFSYEAFETLVVEIEAVLNSRPLSPMSSDPSDLAVLTPAHFLIGGSLLSIPEHDFTNVAINRLSAWQHVQKLKRDFWTRWSKEYLNELHQRSKWKRNVPSGVEVGTMVLIREDNVPPLLWPLGRVIRAIPGADEIMRVVVVKTAKGVYERAVKKLVILPIAHEANDVIEN